MTPQLSWEVASGQRHELDGLVAAHPFAHYHVLRFGPRRPRRR